MRYLSKMRFNDRELIKISEGASDMEGVLHHMKPIGNDWSEWYQQGTFKERIFKLIGNLLFYYRINESEPLGILVLENYQVAYESNQKRIPFAFSLTFKVREGENKHVFSCRCESDVNKWVSKLKVAAYEHWRTQYLILKAKILMKTGRDPVLDYLRNKNQTRQCSRLTTTTSTFYAHIQFSSTHSDDSNTTNVTVGNLIDL